MSEVETVSQRRSFLSHVLSLRRWEKNFLLFGIVAAIAGAAVRSHLYFTNDTAESLSQKLSPVAMRVGMSIVLGFFVGWALRSALKVALSLTLFIVLAWWGLSYLGWVDADVNVTSLSDSAKKATTWVEGQADHITRLFKAYVPSAFGGTVGLLVGFRRR